MLTRRNLLGRAAHTGLAATIASVAGSWGRTPKSSDSRKRDDQNAPTSPIATPARTVTTA